jgi:hypothetical protein
MGAPHALKAKLNTIAEQGLIGIIDTNDKQIGRFRNYKQNVEDPKGHPQFGGARRLPSALSHRSLTGHASTETSCFRSEYAQPKAATRVLT